MDLGEFNIRLADQYGKDLTGHPQFRLVWSEFQTEQRYGEFTDYAPGTNQVVRHVVEVREVRKYPYIGPQWVLERITVVPHETGLFTADNTSYEPFWTFGYEENGLAKEPVWVAIEFLIAANRNPEVLSPSQMRDDEEQAHEREDQMMLDYINASVRNDPLHSAVQDGDAVFLNQDYHDGRNNR